MSYIREYAEWNNNWWEQAGDFEITRVLLIGDSITNGYRDRVQNILKADNIAVDKLCGSRCASDPMLRAEIELALGELNGYKYKAIHFNNGLHGGCNDTSVPLEDYMRGVCEIVDVIQRLQPDAALILATSTHMTKKGEPHDIVDRAYNAFVLERNSFLRRFAAERGLLLDDLYYEMAGNSEYSQPDGVHFSREGFDKLGDIVASQLRVVL